MGCPNNRQIMGRVTQCTKKSILLARCFHHLHLEWASTYWACVIRAGSVPSLGRSPGSGLCLWSLVTILLLAKHHTSKKCSKYVCGACSEASGLQKAGPWPSIYFIGALRLKRACCLFTREARLIWQKKNTWIGLYYNCDNLVICMTTNLSFLFLYSSEPL